MANIYSMDMIDRIDQLIPEKAKRELHSKIQKKVNIEGFRRGKTSFEMIRHMRGNSLQFQMGYLVDVVKTYYPDIPEKKIVKGKIYPFTSEDELEKLPAKMALHLLKAPFGEEDRDFKSFEEEIEAYSLAFHEILTTNEGEEPDPENEAADGTENVSKLDEYLIMDDKKETATTEENVSEREGETAQDESLSFVSVQAENEYSQTADNAEEWYKSVEKLEDLKNYKEGPVLEPYEMDEDESNDGNDHSGTEYLGYIQVISRDNSKTTFTNFLPCYRISRNGSFVPVQESERYTSFPERGAVNIQSTSTNYMYLPNRMKNGRTYIVELSDLTMQFDPEKQAKYTIIVDELEKRLCLHEPHMNHYALYQIYSVPELKEKLLLGRDIPVVSYREDLFPNSQVLLEDEGILYGPFFVKNGPRSNYINPGLREKKYVFDTYRMDENRNALLTLQYEDGIIEKMADLHRLTCHKLDLLPDEMLFAEIKTFGTELDVDAMPSNGIFSADLPEEVIESRKKRILRFFNEKQSFKQLAERCEENIKQVLMRAVRSNDADYLFLTHSMAEDQVFIDCISLNHELSEKAVSARKAAEDELSRLDEETGRKKKEFEALCQQMADAEREKRQELKIIQEKLDLAEEIEGLRSKKEDVLKSVTEKRDELERLKSETESLKLQFDEAAQKPLKRVADALMDEQIFQLFDRCFNRGRVHASAETETVAKKPSVVNSLVTPQTLNDAALPAILVDRFKKYRPYYPINDILNMFICFAQNFITVFSGAPGTGKTTACAVLSHALGLDHDKENSRLIFVPVERGWSSKRDFIGFFNPLTKAFDQSLTQVCRALEVSDAECKAERGLMVPPLAILLDEANLSPIEYYLAPFLNVMEDSCGVPQVDMGSGISYRISRSMRFLATINNDQTTESLSPRLIDRAWVITLPDGGSGSKPLHFDEKDDFTPIPVAQILRVFGAEEDNTQKPDPSATPILKRVYDVCRAGNLDISPRTKGAIRSYCQTGERIFKDYKGTGRAVATISADYSVSQRILPKIQGYGENYEKRLLKPLLEVLENEKLTGSAKLLSKIIENGNENMYSYHFFD